MANVHVPGQRFRHAHICQQCGHIWKHKAPTPMSEALNDAIHTCNVCGARRYIIDYACPMIAGLDMEVLAVIGVLALGALFLLRGKSHAPV